MQKLILLIIFLTTSVGVQASCCTFDLAYTPEILKTPEEETLLKCIKRERCDSLFLFTARMIRAYEGGQPAAVTMNFQRALSIMNTMGERDTSVLKIIYLYATFIEREGEGAISSAYYQYIVNKARDNSVIKMLAQIGVTGIKNNLKDLKRAEKDVVSFIENNNSSVDENLSLLIRFAYYLNNKDGYRFINDNLSVLYGASEPFDSELYYLYLSRVVEILSDEEKDKRFNDYYFTAGEIFKTFDHGKYYKNHLRVKSLVSIANDRYADALKETEELVKLHLAESESIEDFKIRPPRYSVAKYKSIQLYATANLFQTRLRPDLQPVLTAFDLYELAYTRKLENSLLSVNGLIADKLLFTPSYEVNVLIVGYYLYQKTNDLDYISRAVSIVDGHIGAGNYYWSSARDYARSNDSFWEEILAQRAAADKLSSVSSQPTLAAIFSAQKEFTERRSELRTNHPGFFDNLKSNSSIDLNKVSEWCARDSSSILAFYMFNGEVYRLFISPDTVNVSDMYRKRSKIISVTKELSSISNPKTKADDIGEVSRKLYSLLFAGIDSLLPKRVHIIATGELENVPFPALRREAPGEPARYLGTEIAISRQMSINSMRLMRDQEMNPRYEQPLGMAPSFANEYLPMSDLRQAGFVLPPLLYNTDEVEGLEARGPGSFFYGKNATLDNYLSSVTEHSIVHLATHAISSETDGLRSRIYLASGTGGETVELQASDIGDKTLNADLVVLSACETGSGGRHATEGRVSLTKAYLAAGARSVVSSSWAVDDFATAALMEVFYEHIEAGQPPHEALRLSRKAYLEKYPDAPPYKWAAFDAYGGMKAVRWDRSRSKWPLIGYGMAGLILFILGRAVIRRRRHAA